MRRDVRSRQALRGLTLFLLSVVFSHCASAVTAARHALLVGVVSYDESVRFVAPPLEGPANDVALIWRLLREAGLPAESISVLTDETADLPEDARARLARPTRGTIISELDRLATSVAKDDEVMIYLAGHGSQLPARASASGDEPDGLDEVFLPVDFMIDLSGPVPRYSNELRDNDIGARIDRMIARGAHVWLVADTCHAGSLRRGAPADLVPRQMTLWRGDSAMDANPEPFAAPQQGSGRFVAFYGARAGALAYETQVPGAWGEDDRSHGLLTWALARAVRSGARDYRDLAQAVGAVTWELSNGQASPEFSGALASSPMIGAAPQIKQRFPLLATPDGVFSAAGRLDGWTEGLKVAIGWSGAPSNDPPLAIATVAKSGLLVSSLALPPVGTTDAAGLEQSIRDEGLDPLRYRSRWLQDRSAALVVWPWAVEPGNTDVKTGKLAELTPVRSAAHLRRLGENAQRDSALSRDLAMELAITPSGSPDCDAGPIRIKPDDRVVDHCDTVTITLRNKGRQALDVTPLYLGPDDAVYFLSGYAGSQSGGLRVAPGQSQTIQYIEDTSSRAGQPAVTGPVTLLMLAVPATGPGQPPADFRFLQSAANAAILRSAVTDQTASDSVEFGARLLNVTTRAPEFHKDDHD